jgi:hypothetical protein
MWQTYQTLSSLYSNANLVFSVSSGATTGAHQSIQSPLSANVSRPSLDFGAFSRSDGSTSIDSNGM